MLYFIIIISIVFSGFLAWGKSSKSSYYLFAVLFSLSCIFILSNEGKIDETILILKHGNTNITVSLLNKLFKEDESIREAIVKIYGEHFFTEEFILDSSSDKWKITEKDGKTYLALKLRYEPVLNTVEIDTDQRISFTSSIGHFYDSGYYYALVGDSKHELTNRILDKINKKQTTLLIKYLRK